jgi:hypothetical protein
MDKTIEPFYDLNLDDEIHTDTRQHLITLIQNRVNQINPKNIGDHVYSLRIFKNPTRKDYHDFELSDLQEISRKLTNGLSSLGSITNRVFWNRYINGGVRFTTVQTDELSEFPTFIIEYILFSHYDNLDIRLSKNINTRIRIIDKSLVSKFEYIGSRESIVYGNIIPEYNEPELKPIVEQKLGFNMINEILDLEFQRPRFFGQLFKSTSKLVKS